MKIKAGIIGCGNIAWKWDRPDSAYYNTHAKAYYRNPSVQLKACCDIQFKNARGLARAYPGVRPYRDYKEMLAKEKLDIVSVCTPTPAHYEILKYILTSTNIRYILAEKPLSSSAKETKEISELAKKKKANISINYIRRFDKAIRKLKDIMVSQDFGRFLFGSFVYYGGFKNNGIHFLDFLNYIGLECKFDRFTSEVKRFKEDFSGSFLLKTKKGHPIYFNGIDRENFSCLDIDLCYEKGRIRLDDYSNVDIYRPKKAKDFPDFVELKLKKRLPSTILSVMRYSVEDIVGQYKNGAMDYKPLERELKLMKFVGVIQTRLRQ